MSAQLLRTQATARCPDPSDFVHVVAGIVHTREFSHIGCAHATWMVALLIRLGQFGFEGNVTGLTFGLLLKTTIERFAMNTK